MTTAPAPPPQRRSRGARRLGYAVAVVVNLVLWYLVNVRPGWEVVPFLTDGVEQLLWLVNLSLLAGAVANLAYIVFDAPWFKAAGEVVLAIISLALSVTVFEVFPFDFTGLSYDLTTLARVVVALGVLGSAMGLAVSVVAFVRAVARGLSGQD